MSGGAYRAFYRIASEAALPFVIPYLLAAHKHRANLPQRLGRMDADVLGRLGAKPTIWIHSVSVGEFGIAATFLDHLRPHCPGHQFLVSVTTITGHEVARRRLRPEDLLLYFPLDIWHVMRRAVRLVKPELALIIETEIWPGFIYELDAMGAPVAIINGRLSAKSYGRYSMVRPAIADVLRRIARYNMQTQSDARRVTTLGAPAGRVNVTGNIKFDAARIADEPSPDEALRAEIAMPPDTPVLLAAALEKTGDEDPVMLDILAALRAQFGNAALIIVPRHPERGPAIAALVASRGFIPRRRSLRETFDEPARQVFIVDTVGELARFYTLAKTVFVGKSLFPPGGGQNMIEPVALGVPTLYGPYTSNFRGIADTLAECGGARIVAGRDELLLRIIELWKHPEAAREMTRKGREFIRAQQGAIHRNVETALELLASRGTAASPCTPAQARP